MKPFKTKCVSTLLVFLLGLHWSPLSASTAQSKFQLRLEQAQNREKALRLQKNPAPSEMKKLARLMEDLCERNPREEAAMGACLSAGLWREEIYRGDQKKDGLENALKSYRTIWAQFPKLQSADDALYLAARIKWHVFKDQETARYYLEKILQEYGEGDQVKRARILLGSLPESSQVVVSQIFDPEKISVSTKEQELQVAFPLNPGVEVKKQALMGKENRLFFDFVGVDLNTTQGKTFVINKSPLKQIRVGQYKSRTVRMVFDLGYFPKHDIRRFENPPRMEIVLRKTPEQNPTLAASIPVKAARNAANASREFLVVIDPGHGGEDPGAIGARGIKEKDVALMIAKRLKRHLDKVPGIRAVLTRDEDIFIPLEERSKIANEKKADLFLSIHCNAHNSSRMRGVQTYFLDTIKDQYSRKLAARENAMSLDKMSDLEMILLDLANRETHEQSSRVAGLIQHSMLQGLRSQFSGIEDLGVRTAVFLVLFYAEMPAVLVETSFISNRTDEARLNSSAYQEKIASSLTKGVQTFVMQGDKLLGTL